ncbi:histamine N-methyltransferase-like [Saccoglossus kowalevskii]
MRSEKWEVRRSKDAMLINILIQKYREIYYKVIEPCKDACAEFKKVIHSNQAAWRGVHFNFYVQTIEEHLNEKGGMNYDLIHCIHSTYHIANLKQSLVELYRMLADSGMLFIRVSSGNWEKCYLKTSEYYHDPKTNYKGASFVKDSIVQSIPRVTMTTQYREMPINVTQCFQEGGSENGDKMTDFIFQILNFRKTVPQERRDSLLRYFREQCSVTKNGMVVLYDGEEDIAFFK